jgi:hypothetical protein
MDIDSNFPTKVQTVADVPEPLRGALKDRISSNERVSLIIYSPAFSALDECSPATTRVLPPSVLAPASALAVLENGWLVATEEKDGIAVESSKFDETLCLQLTSILLSGEFKIFFASVGRPYVASLRFNTVHEDFYREAINLILDGIDDCTSRDVVADHGHQALFDGWPMKFRSEAERYQPAGQTLITATRWNAIPGGFEQNLSSAGALLVTARTLVSILEQQPTIRRRAFGVDKFGGIITYFPSARLSDFHISHHGRFGVLALQVQAIHGQEKLQIIFPSHREKAIAKTVRWAFPEYR